MSKTVNQENIICYQCGAKLVFAPGTDSLKCEFCGAINKIEIDETAKEEAKKEHDFQEFVRRQVDITPKTEVLTVECNACGAKTAFDPNVVSGECEFCGSPLIVEAEHKTSVITPQGILPFKITDKESIELYEKWLKSLWFAPNKLKKYAQRSEKLAGVYIPYWTFDTKTTTYYTGRRGDDYQTTETYTNDDGEENTKTITETNWTSVTGTVARDFDDVLVPASNSLPQSLVYDLEPWDLQNIEPYDPKFISGFKSEIYQVALDEGFTVAKKRMEYQIEEDIRRDIGGDHQEINNKDTNYSNITFKHILLPLWISAYRYNDKVYRFTINGRTGKLQGERPVSRIKVALLVMLIIAIIALIMYYSQ